MIGECILQQENEPMMNAPQPTWIIVMTTNNPVEAQVVAGLLETEGIRTLIQNETLGGLYGLTVGTLANVRLLVDEADYERALTLIEEDEEPNALSADNDQIVFDSDVENPNVFD